MSQSILITGASSGMGKDFAKQLVSQGNKVYVAARRVEQMEDLVELGCIAIAMDITNEAQVLACADIVNQNGGLDVLINNAGFGSYGAMEDFTIDDARYQFEVNLFGLARLTQLVLPNMRKNRKGKIINISSMGGKVYMPLGSWYHGTKHALEGWSDCLRLELKQFNVDVVIIEPGAIETEFGDVMIAPMLKRSGDGPYGELTHKFAEISKQNYKKGGSSKVGVITKLVLHAVNSKKPKTRYVAGKYAKPMMFMRKWFGDRIFDKMILTMAK